MKADFFKKLHQAAGSVLSITLCGYFAYHMIQGERGVLSLLRHRQKVQTLEQKLTEVNRNKSVIEQRVYLLRPNSLDRDMLEEQARKILNYVQQDELIIYDTDLTE